jgi:hypothetical protein
MEERLQHDPHTKHRIKNLLYSFLYDAADAKRKKQLDDLITRNAFLLGNSIYSFRYKGNVYSMEGCANHRRVNNLALVLHPIMAEYLKELEELNTIELPYVIGFINQVLNSSNCLPDYLKVFPEAIHRPIQHLMDTCPCKACTLEQSSVESLKDKNKDTIYLIKQRLVTNLLI